MASRTNEDQNFNRESREFLKKDSRKLARFCTRQDDIQQPPSRQGRQEFLKTWRIWRLGGRKACDQCVQYPLDHYKISEIRGLFSKEPLRV